MGMTGADIGNLAEIQNIAKQSGTLADQTGASTRQAGEQARSGIDEVTAALRQQFDATLNEFRTVTEQARNKVTSAGWKGNARETALQAIHEYEATTKQIDTGARDQLATLNSTLDQQVTTLNDTLGGQFVTMMNQANQAFTQYAASVSSYSNGLVNADNGVTLS